MKFRNVYTLFAIVALAIVFQSRSAGPGSVANLQVTGAPGSSGNAGTCGNSGCHTAGSFNPTLTLTLDNGDYVPLSEYEPGETYFLTLLFDTDGGQSGTGFQAVALDAANEQAGAWGNIPSLAQITNLSNRDYLEHNAPNTGNGGVSWDAQWIAPSEGTGEVTFYVAGLAINGNGNTAGDGVTSSTLTLSEMLPSSTNQLESDFAEIIISPNPLVDLTSVSITSKSAGSFDLTVINTVGQRVHSEQINLQVGQNIQTLNLSNLQSGVYLLQVTGDNQMSTQQLVKL